MDVTNLKVNIRMGAFLFCLVALNVLYGCGHVEHRSLFQSANEYSNRGDYEESLIAYRQIVDAYPKERDRALFEMGIIYAHPANTRRDYQKALECFESLVRNYPNSAYRRDSEMMIFQIRNVTFKDETIAAQWKEIESLQRESAAKSNEIRDLEKKLEALEREVKNNEEELAALRATVSAFRNGPADKILVEKGERRMTLLAKGKVLKTYKIALGGDPVGPKERQGDNKTPEGMYRIDSRNRDSQYHLSLHISYPNEKDKKRARELGVSPGGDIMIHGLKNGFSWAGEYHTGVDWTKGCIAVTDEEIEEIDKLVPNGTPVEIRP